MPCFFVSLARARALSLSACTHDMLFRRTKHLSYTFLYFISVPLFVVYFIRKFMVFEKVFPHARMICFCAMPRIYSVPFFSLFHSFILCSRSSIFYEKVYGF
uniref:Uncharacterized protein n=1 Tax=Oryza brachyantha TaxID=4533 RepID=J3MI91_ORYBR